MTDEVSIRQEPLTIPTYRLGEPERCPIFYAGRGYQGAKGPIYPYPLLDKLTDARRDRTYRAVYLENRYLELCVLPEIGGRIFSGRDKTNGYDFIYRQHVVKPALIGMLGAWISGGVEWNIPHHHRPTTFMPADCHVAANADGGKTIWVGEIECRQRMKWIVGLTLRPDRSSLEITTRVFNRTPYVHSLLCFANVAVHVNDDYQVIFPPGTEFGTQHAKCEFVRWPIADGVYAGVDYAGVDVSWWKNHPSPVSIFAWNEEDDFFGGYDHGRQAGVVHVADHHAVPGKKFFTFGNGPAGKMWDKILTDADGPYLELMAGAYSDNQPDYSWIQPGETKTITEYWYPIRQLGGVANANRDAAVNLTVNGVRARLGFNATRAVAAAVALLRAGEKVLLRQEISISPTRPFVKEVALPEGVQAEDLGAALLLPSGEELIGYRPVRPSGRPMPSPVVPPPPPKDVPTSEELYLAGLRLEQFHSPAGEPEPYYLAAIRRDPGDTRANTALGILYCKRGMSAQAEERLRLAGQRLTRNYTRPKDGEPLYYLGVALRAQGKRREARDAFGRAAWSSAWRSASYHCLAEMAAEEGDWPAALAATEQSLACNALNTKALGLKAALLRKAGRFEDALAATASALALDAMDFLARNERVAILLALGRQEPARREGEELAELMRGAVQNHLELACDYENCGLWDEAIEVSTRLVGPDPASPGDPMVRYALGYYWQRKGRHEQAAEQWRLAAKLPPDYCFPFRLESVRWLTAAIQRNPADARAHYYLGNLLYDHQPEEAVRAWEESRRLNESCWLVHRNLGLAWARVGQDRARAIASTQRAIECNGQEPRLFLELDQLLEADGAPPRRRLALLEANHDVVARRDDALLREVSLHVFVGQYDRALELLEGRHFHIWEGREHTVHDVYVEARLLKGQGLLAAGRPRDALQEYLLAAEYPDRFEVAEPYDGGRAVEVWRHVATAHEALGDADQARAACLRAVRKVKKGTYLSYYEGLARRKLGEEAKAAACFEQLTRLGQELLAPGAGADFFEKFGLRQSESARQAQGHYLLGLGLLGKGDPAGARQQFQQALQHNVSHLGAQTMLSNS